MCVCVMVHACMYNVLHTEANAHKITGEISVHVHNNRRHRNFRGSLIFVGEHYPRKLDPRKFVPMNN